MSEKQQTIELYNRELINNNSNVTIIEYIKYVAEFIERIDISFMNELLELMVKDDISIHHKYLVEFGIINLKRGTTNLKDMIKQNEFEENKDYTVQNVLDRQSGKTIYKNEYYFHPDAFGIIIMRSKNQKKYSKYYTLCQKCIKYHSKYQVELKQSEISRLIDEQKETNKELRESNKRNEKLEHKLDISNKKLSKIENQNDELLDKVESLEDDNQLIKTKLDISTEDRVLNPNDKTKLEKFIILKSSRKNPEYRYYVIRSQEKYTKNKIAKLKEQKYTPILTLDNITNSTKFYNYVKEKLVNNIECYLNNLNIVNILESNFIEKIKVLYEERKNIELSDSEDE